MGDKIVEKKTEATALITGASSGIGASFARYLSGKGMRVLLTARRKKRLKTLSNEIALSNGSVHIYPADLSIEEERIKLYKTIKKHHEVDILINNAGFGWYGYYTEMPWDIAIKMMKTNMEAVAHMTSLFLPGMLRLKKGHIINIGSIAGIFPNQGVALYSATKSFIDSFATALHRELRGSGVHASIIRLGAVKTEFFEKAKKQKKGSAIPAEKLGIPVDKINSALWKLIKRPRRVVYVPGYLRIAGLAELLIGGIVDKLGPLLLKRKNKTG